MTKVARYGKATAKAGRGEELARILLGAAADLQDDPGCETYLVSRQADAPDVVWVTEIWRSRANLDAALARIRESDGVAAAMSAVEEWQMIELDLLGGKGA